MKLNDDYEDDDFYDEEDSDEDEDFLDDDYEESRPKKKFFEKFSKKKSSDLDDEYLDDEEFDEEPAVKPLPKVTKSAPKAEKVRNSSPKITPMRSNKRNSQSSSMEVCVIKPTSMEDTREIADTLVNNSTVILNLEGIDVEVAQRIIDFTSGACYSLGGSLQKVSSYIFILGPYNVDITGDLQNILGSSAPSVRAGY
ncbi:MAG: cell division protein SepF [Eubacteriales bacterium]|nr:cell division protein SepF [Eubacteriales bacterium]